MPWVTCPIAQVPPNAGLVVSADTMAGGTPQAQYLGIAPVNEDAPAVLSNGAIVASVAVGAALTSTTGNWLGAPTSYAYQWKRGATNIGTNSNTYTTVAGDSGNSITCVVTATNGVGATASPPSNAVAVS